jgi:mono/diheme cytochrome c family protein
MLPRLSLLVTCLVVAGPSPSLAADADHGKAIAERWCSGCHLVQHEQKTAPTDQAPPFVTIAKTPDFDAGRLALLLLEPHPNMPKLSLSRSEIADLAEYIRALPR